MRGMEACGREPEPEESTREKAARGKGERPCLSLCQEPSCVSSSPNESGASSRLKTQS